MNSSNSTTFSYADAGIGARSDAAPQSPCDSAYSRLCRAQDRLKDLIGSLHGNLAPVLRDAKPEQSPSNVTVVGESPQSEIHGRFLAAADRIEELAEHVELILSQVTV